MYPEDVRLPGYQPVTRSPRNLLDDAVKLIEKAKKPIILCGHGVIMSNAEEELMQFAVKTQTPVASTLLG
ncbi:MAG TPA: acetolactate synthase large subunit, partial [Anaerolineales bacterium]|nr:acetolactate synthase large subunit [Anaerolineales bacterium]